MATGWTTFPVEFKGGLISNLSPLQQGVNAIGSATILQNFEPSKDGGYRKVLGYSKFSSDTVPGVGAVLGVKVLADNKALAVRAGDTPAVSNYYTGSGTSWTLVGSAANLGGKVRGVTYDFGSGASYLLVDGVNAPAKFVNATDTLTFYSGLTDAIGATAVAVYKQTVFFAKGTNLVFSAPYSDTDFSAASGGGIINLARDITGLIVFRDQLIIFSRNQIQRLVGSTTADFQLVPITENIGCTQPDSIQEVGGDVMFVAPDGVRLLSTTERIGDFGLEVASDPISKDITSFLSAGGDYTSLVIRGKAQYRLFRSAPTVQTSASRGVLATKFSDQGASRIEWATLFGFKVLCADSKLTSTNNNSEKIFFANTDGYVYLMDEGSTRDGDAVESIYQSPFMPITDPQKRKTLYKMSLYVDTIGAFSADVSFLFDIYKVDNYNTEVKSPRVTIGNSGAGTVAFYGVPTAIFGTSLFGEDVDKVYDTPIVGAGKTFAFRIEDLSGGIPFTLDTAIFEFKENDRQ